MNMNLSANPIKVLAVDDSALMRSLIATIINRQVDMVLVGAAQDPFVARDMIKALNPDVITLDIEMPRMDGLEFLERVMRLRPMPVVMLSTLTEVGSEATLRALELGAVDFVPKPMADVTPNLEGFVEELVAKIRAAAIARPKRRLMPHVSSDAAPPAVTRVHQGSEKIVAIGASTGGTEAICAVLQHLPVDAPGTLITQHMPAGFTRGFAKRLDTLCRISVKEAEDGDRVLPGHALLAPGNRHMELYKSGANYHVRVHDEAPVNRHRPSVDVLFSSVARYAGVNAVGVILTGMGKDGASGMKTMHDAGTYNLAQDEESCVVFGMPREAIALGATHEVLPLERIGPRLCELASTQLRSKLRY